ncbi:MAG: glutamate 5-kinase [Parvularculaceae bacterium]
MPSETSNDARSALAAARRLVVKVGSAILCAEDGAVKEAWLATLAEDIFRLREGGCDIVIVTSGAIALGRKRLGLEGLLRLDEKQAASAAGQAALVGAWQRAFDPFGVNLAQVLLTLEDTENRRRYLNARATFSTLLELGALPVVNENDTIATAEIRYGDNDRLAAHAAQIIGADLLLILSDIDGVYDDDPRKNAGARHLPTIEKITPEIERAAGGANTVAGVGSGGMASKIAAAKIAGAAGCATVIAAGIIERPLAAVGDGARATLIRSQQSPERARRRWIAGRLKPLGDIFIDDGAVKALKSGSSLLPAGIVRVSGDFQRGDAVSIRAQTGDIIAQGLSSFGAVEVAAIAGKKSDEVERILGYRRRPAVIEKNDLVLDRHRDD